MPINTKQTQREVRIDGKRMTFRLDQYSTEAAELIASRKNLKLNEYFKGIIKDSPENNPSNAYIRAHITNDLLKITRNETIKPFQVELGDLEINTNPKSTQTPNEPTYPQQDQQTPPQ